MINTKCEPFPNGLNSNAFRLQTHGCLREAQLAARWQVSRRTLQRWRQQASGPAWLQINGVILYREADIQAFEECNRNGRSE